MVIFSLAMIAIGPIPALYANNYQEPKAIHELLEIEKITLPAHHMRQISHDLVTIASRSQDTSNRQRRSTAQLLCLAIALDLSNQGARDTNELFVQGQLPQPPSETVINQAYQNILSYQPWLSHESAGPTSNKLASLLSDATKTLDPSLSSLPDSGDWGTSIDPLEVYPSAEKPTVTNLKPEVIIEKKVAAPLEKFHLSNLTVYSPVELEISRRKTPTRSTNTKSTATSAQIQPIKLTLKECHPEDASRIIIESEIETRRSILTKNISTVESFLTKRHPSLAAYDAHITLARKSYTEDNGNLLATSMLLMLEASIQNIPLKENLHLCIATDNKGTFREPKNFWKLIQTLRENQQGGTIIVHPSSADLLQQLLVYREPEFFTRWEIHTADTLDDALKLAALDGTETHKKASELFQTIQDLTAKMTVPQMAVNQAVKARLSEILTLAPYHLSAQMLLLQSSRQRPTKLSKKALSLEMLPVITDINDLLNEDNGYDYYNSGSLILKFDTMHEKSREALDELSPYVDGDHDTIYQNAITLANDCRSISLALKRLMRDYYDSSDRSKVVNMRTDMAALSKKLLSQIRASIGLASVEK
ncbi:MAG: hypothetical protein ACSHX0_11485 [Akkermansiaceae bacterium]